MRQTVFIATLGSEPQVVTIALYLLKRSGVAPARALVIHTSERVPAIANALRALRAAFTGAACEGTHLELRPIQCHGETVRDISTQAEAEAAFRTLFDAVRSEKIAGHSVHMSIAGGRKVMAVYGMATAQLLFDEGDSLYHLLSEGALLQEKRMIPAPGDSVRLVPVPILRWSADTVVFAELSRHRDPLEALLHGQELAKRQARERVERFVQTVLTPAETEAARLVVREGLTNAEVGRRLGRSAKTVAHQLGSVYAKLAEHLGWPADRKVDRHTLIAVLHDYFAQA